MATVSKWTPFGVALDVTATGSSVKRTSATTFTVVIAASWETYYSGAQTNYGMSATSGGVTKTISSFGTKRSSGSTSFTGTYSISGNGSATKAITVTFKNFNTDNGNSATKNVTFNVTVPAWTSYTVSYNANGGTGAPGKQTKWKYQTLTLSSTKPTRTGYSFVGWALTQADANAGKHYYLAGGTCGKNENLTLYAVWKANTYTVKFDANGGSLGNVNATQTKTYGVTLKLDTDIPTRTNYNFLGWSTSKTATTATYSAGGNYTTNSGTTLYAVWELAYVRPRITNISGARCVVDDNGTATVNEEGVNAIISFSFECDKAFDSIIIEWESIANSGSKTFDSEYFGVSGSILADTVSIVIGDDSLSTDRAYTIRITGTDANGYTSVTTTLNGLLLAIDVIPENKGIAFGKPAELPLIADFDYTIYPRKGFRNIPIEEYTDLDTLIRPNIYVSQDSVASTYSNCPVSGGTFKMEVAKGGQESQIQQTITYTNMTGFKIYHRQRHKVDSVNIWGDWKCVYSVAGNLLWDGDSETTTNGMFMYQTKDENGTLTYSQEVALSENISAQPHGITLVFSRYDKTKNKGVNEQIVEYTVLKRTVALMPGSGHSIPLLTPFATAVKYLYIRDDRIVGNVNNNKTITVGGITYTNDYFVLRYVIGF